MHYRTRNCSYIICYSTGICSTDTAVSVNEDSGRYSSASTAAHEVGHSLGAFHDNLNINNCDPADQYVMTDLKCASSPNYHNVYLFSPCSVKYFSNMMSSLNRIGISDKTTSRTCHYLRHGWC